MSGYRIWKTSDGRYVGDCHPDAVELVAGPADRQPDDFDPATFEQADGVLGVPAPVDLDDVPAVEDESPDGGHELEQANEKVEASDSPEKPVDVKPAAAKKAPAKKAAAKKAPAKKAAAKKAAEPAAQSAAK